MDEEMNLKVVFCSKTWYDSNVQITPSECEKESLRNITRGKACIMSEDNYPEMDIYALTPDPKEFSLSDDVYPNIVEIASFMHDCDYISKMATVSVKGVDCHDSLKQAILEVMKLLIPQFDYTYEE